MSPEYDQGFKAARKVFEEERAAIIAELEYWKARFRVEKQVRTQDIPAVKEV